MREKPRGEDGKRDGDLGKSKAEMEKPLLERGRTRKDTAHSGKGCGNAVQLRGKYHPDLL